MNYQETFLESVSIKLDSKERDVTTGKYRRQEADDRQIYGGNKTKSC